MKTLNKIIAFILVAILAFALFGCASTASDVKLASKSDLKQYANNKYGTAKFVRLEESTDIDIVDGEDKDYISGRYCYLKDKEYGFEYYVASYVSSLSVDGSVFGYSESKKSDFSRRYLESFMSKYNTELSNIEETYDINIIYDDKYTYTIYVEAYSEDESEIESGVEELGKLIEKFDNRKFLNETVEYNRNEIEVYYDSNIIGIYYIHNGYLNKEGMDIERYREAIASLAKVNKNDVKYLRTELVDFYDSGIDSSKYRDNSDNIIPDYVTFYYFMIDNKEEFISDAMVLGDDWVVYYYNSIRK